jgi:hypothetical protein
MHRSWKRRAFGRKKGAPTCHLEPKYETPRMGRCQRTRQNKAGRGSGAEQIDQLVQGLGLLWGSETATSRTTVPGLREIVTSRVAIVVPSRRKLSRYRPAGRRQKYRPAWSVVIAMSGMGGPVLSIETARTRTPCSGRPAFDVTTPPTPKRGVATAPGRSESLDTGVSGGAQEPARPSSIMNASARGAARPHPTIRERTLAKRSLPIRPLGKLVRYTACPLRASLLYHHANQKLAG